jgi:hypothetical protein
VYQGSRTVFALQKKRKRYPCCTERLIIFLEGAKSRRPPDVGRSKSRNRSRELNTQQQQEQEQITRIEYTTTARARKSDYRRKVQVRHSSPEGANDLIRTAYRHAPPTPHITYVSHRITIAIASSSPASLSPPRAPY